MHIDGITCCVGKDYAQQLSRSLQIWVDTLDTLTIVTNVGDQHVTGVVANLKLTANRVNLIYTDVFTRYGAAFNKGAALNVAYSTANPASSSWVLHFDADIIPPDRWRKLTEQRVTQGRLHGVQRVAEGARIPLDETPIYPYGYFHLWHSADPVTWRWPLFDVWHPHAGNYDADFADLWHRRRRVDLGFTVVHQGTPRVGWFGPDEPRDIHGMQHRMRVIHQQGLRHTRLEAGKGNGRLAVPEPSAKAVIESGQDPQWTMDMLAMCRSLLPHNPFAVTARVGELVLPQPGTIPISYPVIPSVTSAVLRGLIDLTISHSPSNQPIPDQPIGDK